MKLYRAGISRMIATHPEPQAKFEDRLLLAELSAYNKEAISLQAEHDALVPMSKEIEELAAQIEAIRADFEPRLNALVARREKQFAREKVLKARCQGAGVSVDFHQLSTLGAN